MSRVSYATAIGRRSEQQDAFVWVDTPEGTLLAVFDGHGGTQTATTLKDHLADWWSAVGGLDYPLAMKKVFQAAASYTAHHYTGSTASIVFIPKAADIAVVGVIGDSPVLIEKPDGSLFVSPDHNVRSNPEERSAAIARGGIYDGSYIWNECGDDSVGLQMSRALGDANMGAILDRTPEIMTIPLGSYLLLATDGLFDPAHHTQADAICMVTGGLDAGMDVRELVDAAVAMPTHDNVTAILWSRRP